MDIKDSILIGQVLIDVGIITSEQLEAGLKEQKLTGNFICTALVKLGFAPEEKLFGLLA